MRNLLLVPSNVSLIARQGLKGTQDIEEDGEGEKENHGKSSVDGEELNKLEDLVKIHDEEKKRERL